MYDFQEARLLEEIRAREARRVLLQFPEGLKTYGPKIARDISEKAGVEAYVSGEPCWGACDLALEEARAIHADLLVHYGHNQFMGNGREIPVLYLTAPSTLDITPVVKQAIPLLAGPKVCVSTTVQHVQALESLREPLKEQGLTMILPSTGAFTRVDGQILGCDYVGIRNIEDQVDSFLVVGSLFHALGAALSVEKPVVMADPYSGRVQELSEEKRRVLRQRYALIEKARRAERFGVVLSTKPGQCNPQIAAEIKRLIESKGKKAVSVSMREIVPDRLAAFPELEVFVDTACPRLALDDPERFGKPILSRDEILVAMDQISWESLLSRGLVRL